MEKAEERIKTTPLIEETYAVHMMERHAWNGVLAVIEEKETATATEHSPHCLCGKWDCRLRIAIIEWGHAEARRAIHVNSREV